MRRFLKAFLILTGLAVAGQYLSSVAPGQVPDGVSPFEGGMFPGQPRPDPRLAEYAAISKGAKTYEGLFKLYQKDESVYAELQPQHFAKQYLLPIAIAKGAGLAGMTANGDEQWVVQFKRVGEKVHVIRRNVHHKARPGTPTAKAVEMSYTDSVLMALRIPAINPATQGVLINLNDIFFGDIGELGIGRFDPARSTWSKIKAFPRNVELEVQGTFVGGGSDDSVIDPRGKTIFVHYGLVELQDTGYQPRAADPRVGYFVTAQKDYSIASKDSPFVRHVNRWRLEPAEPIVPGKLSVPKRSIKYYIEKTVPHEYRAAVQDGILEWNKAFEKIGFRNAIEAVQMRDEDEFDPEDMNYNTIRWVTNEQGYAIGPSRANPLTGEILDADILFDGDFIRYWKQERQLFKAEGKEFEPSSPVQSLDLGWGLNSALLANGNGGIRWNDANKSLSDDELRLKLIRQGQCQCREHRRAELSIASLSMLEFQEPKKEDKKDEKKPDDKKDPKDEKKDPKPKEVKDALLEEYINQAIKDTIMHEVGHTLGLRHNFKASTLHANDKLHDTKVTREQGLTASVMDYTPVNLAPKGVKQGDFFTTTLGIYDYWAIEYGYKPCTDDELKKIASKGASTPGLDYGTDEDTVLTSDPMTNRFDLGAEPMKYAQDRMLATQELLKTLPARVTEDGEGYQRTRVAFTRLLGQYGNSAYFIAKYIGGEHAYRDYKGDAKGRDPLVPVPAAKQREALKFLQENVLSDKPYQFPPELLRKLGVERWSHWGADTASTDFPIYDRILGIQKIALNQMFNAKVLQRVQATALKDEKETKPLTLAEIFRCATDGVWTDLGKADAASSTIRRNLQREHLKKLGSLVLGEKSGGSLSLASLMAMMDGSGGSVPADARSLARFHLKEIAKKLDTALAAKPADETTVAHLEESKERIAKILSASMQVNE